MVEFVESLSSRLASALAQEQGNSLPLFGLRIRLTISLYLEYSLATGEMDPRILCPLLIFVEGRREA